MPTPSPREAGRGSGRGAAGPGSPFPRSTSAIPTIDPCSEASSTTGTSASGPNQAPKPASSHTSPNPSASFLKTFAPSHESAAKTPKPIPAPYTA